MKETLTIPISMARFTSFSWRPSITIPIPIPIPVAGPLFRRRKQFFSVKPQFLLSPKPQRLLVFAANNEKKEEENNEAVREVEDKEEQKPSGSNGEEEDDKKNFSKERRTIFSLSWNSLFDPDPDNVVALGLTGILTWASVQVLWQLLFISFAILVAAIKYKGPDIDKVS
ncbi:hypothetical protein AAHE18_03G042600 [Arachis hypogaea]|nr:uncharacterized protein LOC112788933 isoform X1 [Arachis hypogaea]